MERGFTPRGLAGTVEATVGVGIGAVAGAMASDIALNVCVDTGLLNGVTPVGPPIVASNALYGGSIAGGLIDAGGDGAASVTNNSLMDPIYRLRTTTTNCMGATGQPVATLYDNPAGPFTVATSFGSASVPEAFFGSTIPSLDGPDINGGLDLRVAFRLTDFDMAVMSAVGRMEGILPAPVVLPRVMPSRAVSSEPAPAFTLVQRSQLPGLFYLTVAAARGLQGPFTDTASLALGGAIGPLVQAGGVMIGSLTDFGGGTCTLTHDGTDPIYLAEIDGITEFTMRSPPQSITASGVGDRA